MKGRYFVLAFITLAVSPLAVWLISRAAAGWEPQAYARLGWVLIALRIGGLIATVAFVVLGLRAAKREEA